MEERLKRLSGIIPFLFALGCARAWVTLVVVMPAESPIGSGAIHNYFDIAYCLIALVIAFAAPRIAPLSSRLWVAVTSAALMLAASVCSVLITSVTLLPAGAETALSLVIALFGGVGFSVFLLLWAETLVSLSLLRIFTYTVASQLAGAVFVFFCEGFDTLRLNTCLLLLPLIAAISLRYAYLRSPSASAAKAPVTKTTYPWKLFVLFALYSMAYGLREQQLAQGAGIHSSLSTAIVMVALLIPLLFFSSRMNMMLLFRSPMVLMVCGFLLIPAESLLGSIASSFLISMSYSLMTILVALILYDISKRTGIAILLFASIKSFEQIFVIGGRWLSGFLESTTLFSGSDSAIITGMVVVLVLASTIILYSKGELTSKWGVVVLDSNGLVEKSEQEERLQRACVFLVERYHLSPREEEVFRMLCEGKTAPKIQQELVIAPGTLKAHTRHIYEKLGINSRKEMMAMVASASSAVDEAPAK